MTWMNAFDVATCTVTVTQVLRGSPNVTTVLFSGDLAKGGTQNFTSSDFVGNTFTLAVDASGKVTFSFDGTYIGGFEFDVDVAPAALTNVVGGRVSDFLQFVDTNGAPAGVQTTRSDGLNGSNLALVAAGQDVTPNPAVLASGPTESIGASIYVGAS